MGGRSGPGHPDGRTVAERRGRHGRLGLSDRGRQPGSRKGAECRGPLFQGRRVRTRQYQRDALGDWRGQGVMRQFVSGNLNYSSWSIRPLLVSRKVGLPVEEVIVPLDFPETTAQLKAISPNIGRT